MCHSVKYQLCYRLQYNTKDYDIVGIAVFLYLLDFKELNNVFYVIRNESLGRNMPYFKW